MEKSTFFKSILRMFSRLLFHFSRFILRIFESTKPSIYMNYYIILLKFCGVTIHGKPKYIASDVLFDDFYMIQLGDDVIISRKVTLLTHDYSITTGLISINRAPDRDIALLKDIIIGNNVFIGLGVIILPGTTIGNNVIIGAGSVVKGHIGSDSIAIGNPAQVVSRLTERAEKWSASLTNLSVRRANL